MNALPSLPEAPPVNIRCPADFYGASLLVAAKLGLPAAPPSPSTWVHGCDILPVPREVFSPHVDNPEQTHLVATQRSANWWRQNGFAKAVAVGCPILYTSPSGQVRRPGSALIMPNHSLPDCTRDKEHSASWLRMVSGLQARFSMMTVCLHEHDVPDLAPLAEAAGLTWITGARHDTFSLPRMRAIFESFEFVFTDVQGSHLPYAAWFGCKVAFLEPLYQRQWDQHKDHHHFTRYPELRKNLVFHERDNIRARMPFLFPARPEEAVCPRDWAEDVLGVASMREPAELARLLGWRWAGNEPAFADTDYERAAALLGAANPSQEVESLREGLAKLRAERDALKQEAKQTAKLLKSLEKQRKADESFRKSMAGRIARPLFSIEKRVRRLFQKSSD
jgi:hypothetical protein